MIIALIVYGISWGILLAIYLYSKLFEKDKQKDSFISTKNSNEPWYFYALLIIFAPIVVCCVPYILIKGAWDDRKYKKYKEEQEKKEKELEAKKTKAFDNFKSGTRASIQPDRIDKCQQLRDFVHAKNYQCILESFSNIHLPVGYKLDINFAEGKGSGDHSTLIVRTPAGDVCNVFDAITVDDSPMGALEVYLLYEMWHYLPLFWHTNYASRTYIYATEELGNILDFHGNKIDVIAQFDVSPIVSKNKNKYYVSCCYWSNWGGLVRELVEIEIKDNKVVNIFDVDTTTLYKYDCGILF